VPVNEPYRGPKFKYKKLHQPPKIISKLIPSQYQPNPEIYEWLVNELTLSSIAKDYLLQKRGFSEQMVKELEIKDVPDPNTIFQKLTERWGKEALINCGLLKFHENNIKGIWWDHVLVFPFNDLNLRITYLQARRMCTDPGKFKYLALSQLKPAIYNINILTQLKEGDNLFICEGVPDTITAMELKMPAIGVLGANSFDDDVVDLLLQYRINIFPDTDPAGQLFVRKVRQAFYEKGKTIQERSLPKPYKDLNEYFISENNRPK
jgi:DNA primase